MPPVSPDIRAAAIADLTAGEQPAIVAERYGLPRNTVKQWRTRYVPADVPDAAPAASPPAAPIRPTVVARQQRIGDLIIDLLAAKLEASRAIAHAASDPAWLQRQPAAELAALGDWLDASALAIGDRLAGRAGGTGPSDPNTDS